MQKLIYLWLFLCCLMVTIIICGFFQIHKRAEVEGQQGDREQVGIGVGEQLQLGPGISVIAFFISREGTKVGRPYLGAEEQDPLEKASDQITVKAITCGGEAVAKKHFKSKGEGLRPSLCVRIDTPVGLTLQVMAEGDFTGLAAGDF